MILLLTRWSFKKFTEFDFRFQKLCESDITISGPPSVVNLFLSKIILQISENSRSLQIVQWPLFRTVTAFKNVSYFRSENDPKFRHISNLLFLLSLHIV